MSGFRNPQSLEYIVFIIGCSAPFPIFDECHQAERRARENGSQHKDSRPVLARNKLIVMPDPQPSSRHAFFQPLLYVMGSDEFLQQQVLI